MASELEAVQTKNIYDTAIKQINHIKVNLLKECYEYLGIDFGETKNEIVYHNYLADDPITINTNDGTYENEYDSFQSHTSLKIFSKWNGCHYMFLNFRYSC